MVIRTYHHADPMAFPVSAVAEGLLEGGRRTVHLRVERAAQPGVWVVRGELPKGGSWVVAATLSEPAGGKAAATALVALGPAGDLMAVQVPHEVNHEGWVIPRPATRAEIESLIRMTAAAKHRAQQGDLAAFDRLYAAHVKLPRTIAPETDLLPGIHARIRWGAASVIASSAAGHGQAAAPAAHGDRPGRGIHATRLLARRLLPLRHPLPAVTGDIAVSDGVYGRGRFESIEGAIRFVGVLAAAGDFEFINHAGPVELRLPASVAADFVVNTFHGEIENAFGSYPSARTRTWAAECWPSRAAPPAPTS
ncbi:MAG TPA: hypothetical protein VF192_12920 [Longimicrobiales bacterium]